MSLAMTSVGLPTSLPKYSLGNHEILAQLAADVTVPHEPHDNRSLVVAFALRTRAVDLLSSIRRKCRHCRDKGAL